jgi:hypothetical protein
VDAEKIRLDRVMIFRWRFWWFPLATVKWKHRKNIYMSHSYIYILYKYVYICIYKYT